MQLEESLVTQLSFSAGTGSGCIAEMIINGHLARPKNFVVIRSNPGMENSKTNTYAESVATRLRAIGIPYLEVKRNLLKGLLELKASGRTRFDLPPFWTRNRITGKKGRLLQRCTKWAKIQPMDNALRLWMESNLGISSRSKKLGVRTVRKWIGFSHDEVFRIKEAKQKYVFFDYPLIDAKMAKMDVASYYRKIGIPIPPRSVCNACFANDINTFKDMHDNRPDEFWNEAVAVDEQIRDLRHVGVNDECFVSSTMIPLRELAERNFILPSNVVEDSNERCHSGHCFV